MADLTEIDVTSGGHGAETPAIQSSGTPEVDSSRAALVSQWAKRVEKAKKHHEDAFKQMRECMELARYGADKDWIKAGNYVVPILPRHINQVVAQLYAKNPKAVVTRKKKLLFKLWDGTSESAMAAYQAAQPQQMPTSIVDPVSGAPLMMQAPGDPQAMAIVQEILAAQQQIDLFDKLGQTMELLYEYYMSEQQQSYKAQLKKMVRRTKTTAVGYLKVDFQRMLERRPDIASEIDDISSKIAQAEVMLAKAADGETHEGDAEVEQLRLTLKDLESEEMIVVREGPVLAFPKSTQIIVDPACTQLKTLAGADWIAIEYDMTPDKIRSIYDVDIGKTYTGYSETKTGETSTTAKVYEVWDRVNRQVSTICLGYPNFLKEPATPTVRLDRFFTVFPLVFNEVEHDDALYPPSDVWLARHPQDEYNRAREGLREHRNASRPWYAGAKGAIEEKDKTRIANHAAHEYIEFNVPPDRFDIAKLVQRGPVIPIDPNMYEVNNVFSDILRSVGSQEANLGGTANGTATESSIAESSRNASISDNVDDLDEFLSDVAHGIGQLMLSELSVETVQEIVGPGAVWPEQQMTREQISKDLSLNIRAGSSGRPNRASELANMERAMPFLQMLQGINPLPIARKYLGLLDIDLEEAIVEGLPSISAVNAMAAAGSANGAQGAMPTGDPRTDPAMQGGAGAANVQSTDVRPGGPQPAYPAPMPS